MKFPILLLLALLLAFTFTLAPHKTIHAAPNGAFVVNNANDADDGQCNSAHCSLREAIHAATANAGLDAIHFNIGSCPCIIYPNSQLPEITDPVITHVTHVILNGVKNLSLCGGDSSQKRLRMTIPA